MNLAFLQYGNRAGDIECAKRMLASAREYMPELNIFHMAGSVWTGETFYKDADLYRYEPYTEDDFYGTYYAKHLVRLGNEPTIICDVDVIFKRDIRYLFDADFDVALCIRDDHYARPAHDKYIGGFMLSRNGEFWKRVRDVVNCMVPQLRQWIGIQYALQVASQDFVVRELPEAIYNYAPLTEDDSCKDAQVIHYRGKRKEWMIK